MTSNEDTNLLGGTEYKQLLSEAVEELELDEEVVTLLLSSELSEILEGIDHASSEALKVAKISSDAAVMKKDSGEYESSLNFLSSSSESLLSLIQILVILMPKMKIITQFLEIGVNKIRFNKEEDKE